MTTRWTLKRARTCGALIVLAALAAGCSSATSTESTTTDPLTTEVAVTEVEVTEVAATEPLTTEGATTEAPAVETAASGSGCIVSGDTISDGLWFGYINAASEADLTFDLACWFGGDAAIAASAADGEESPPPNDYYIRNDSNSLREVTLGPSPTVTWMPSPADPATTETVSYSAWLTGREARPFQPGVWITIDQGVVTVIEEQYVP